MLKNFYVRYSAEVDTLVIVMFAAVYYFATYFMFAEQWLKATIFNVCQIAPIFSMLFNRYSREAIKSVLADTAVIYAIIMLCCNGAIAKLGLAGYDKYLMCLFITLLSYVAYSYLLVTGFSSVGEDNISRIYNICEKFRVMTSAAVIVGTFAVVGYFGTSYIWITVGIHVAAIILTMLMQMIIASAIIKERYKR